MIDWKNSISSPAGTFYINNIESYIEESCTIGVSPIDYFYLRMKELILLGDSSFCTNNPNIAPLIVVGIISCCEFYFTNVLSSIIKICPISRVNCEQLSINLATVLWHAGMNVEKSALENKAFSNAESIHKTIKQYTGIETKSIPELMIVLEEFDKCCELRHCIAHNNNFISGKNATKLAIHGVNCNSKIVLSEVQIQNVALVCQNLVRAYNLHLFKELAKRWAIDWPKKTNINPRDNHKGFKAIWNIFYSRTDADHSSPPSPLSLVKCRNQVLKEFNIL